VNRPIRRIAGIMMLLYVVLFAQLNNLQLFGAERLNSHPELAKRPAFGGPVV
jgi:hypothetical protein